MKQKEFKHENKPREMSTKASTTQRQDASCADRLLLSPGSHDCSRLLRGKRVAHISLVSLEEETHS